MVSRVEAGVWGLLVAGWFFITVLPEGQAMTSEYYTKIIYRDFPTRFSIALGTRARPCLLQDHERCLRERESLCKRSGVAWIELPHTAEKAGACAVFI